jgi:hypothetical protein
MIGPASITGVSQRLLRRRGDLLEKRGMLVPGNMVDAHLRPCGMVDAAVIDGLPAFDRAAEGTNAAGQKPQQVIGPTVAWRWGR